MNKHILLLTSVAPNFSAGLVYDYVEAFKMAGYSVDILTKYKVDACADNVIYAYETEDDLNNVEIIVKNNLLKRCFYFVLNKLTSLISHIKSREIPVFPYANMQDFDYPVPSSSYISKLKEGKYTAVFALYLQYMFTEQSLRDIYNKLKVPIYAFTIDMYLMTGGCYYPGKCVGYKKGCINCSFVKRENRGEIRRHFNEKQKIYSEIGLILLGNTWTELFFKQSLATKMQPFYKKTIIINEDVFSIKDAMETRRLFGISDDNKFIILAGVANNTPRKGFKYLVEAVNSFYALVPEIRRNDLLLVLIGRGTEQVEDLFKLDLKLTGFLDINSLSAAYSFADVYISPSIDDAGPSMVNQSLMCGTPVVSFNIGTALDVVNNGETGYAVELKNSAAMANAILQIFNMSSSEYQKMRKKCRDISIDNSSIEATCNFLKSII